MNRSSVAKCTNEAIAVAHINNAEEAIQEGGSGGGEEEEGGEEEGADYM